MLLQALGLIVLLFAATPSALLIGVLCLPTALVGLADRQPGRPAARAVFLFGLAACCPALVRLWQEGHRMDEAVGLALDLHNVAQAWATQAAGWLLAELLPFLFALAAEARADRSAQRLRRLRTVVSEEWRS